MGGTWPDRFANQQFIAHLYRQAQDPQGAYRTWRGVRVFLRWCVDEGWYERAALPDGPRLRELPACRPALTDAQIAQVYALAPADATRRLVLLLWVTGWRAEKVRTLRWTDVDLAHACLHFSDHEGDRLLWPLDRALQRELAGWHRGATGEYVLTDSEGHPWTADTLRTDLRAAGVRVGLPSLSPGHFQQAFLYRYLRSGALNNSRVLRGLLGQPIHAKRLHLTERLTTEELRRGYDGHSPMEAALRPSRPTTRRRS